MENWTVYWFVWVVLLAALAATTAAFIFLFARVHAQEKRREEEGDEEVISGVFDVCDDVTVNSDRFDHSKLQAPLRQQHVLYTYNVFGAVAVLQLVLLPAAGVAATADVHAAELSGVDGARARGRRIFAAVGAVLDHPVLFPGRLPRAGKFQFDFNVQLDCQ